MNLGPARYKGVNKNVFFFFGEANSQKLRNGHAHWVGSFLEDGGVNTDDRQTANPAERKWLGQ